MARDRLRLAKRDQRAGWDGLIEKFSLTPYNTGKAPVLIWFSCFSASMKVKLQCALAMLQDCGALVIAKTHPSSYCSAPLSPREFSLFHALSAVISCRSNSLIYSSGCLPVSFDAALRLTCANVINLPCPWLCWREERDSRGEQGTQGMVSLAKSTFSYWDLTGFSRKTIPTL